MKQNWRRKSCGCQFIVNPEKRELDERDNEMVVNMLHERISIRDSTRLERFPKLPEKVHQNGRGSSTRTRRKTLNKDETDFEQDDVEMDEIWT